MEKDSDHDGAVRAERPDSVKRNAILIELNPEYAAMAARRIYNEAPLFADVSQEKYGNPWHEWITRDGKLWQGEATPPCILPAPQVVPKEVAA